MGLTNAEKISLYDKYEKALRIEHPVIVYGLTRTQIIELIKLMIDQARQELLSEIGGNINNNGGSSSNIVLVKKQFNSLGEFKDELNNVTYTDKDSISIGDDVYTLDRSSNLDPDDYNVIGDPGSGSWIRNEGVVPQIDNIDPVTLTVDDAEEAWNNA